MMRALLLALVWTLAALPAAADVLQYRSVIRAETAVTPKWTHDGANLSPEQINALVAEANGIELRFDLSRYVGKNVRIHMVLPPTLKGLRGSAGFRAEWRTRGRFIPGSVVPGGRTLVYQGPIPTKELTEVFDFTLHMDGRYFTGGLGFDPVFEIESLPQ